MAHDILIIDDEADIRNLVSGVLEDEGYVTRVAADGASGLDAIKARQPSLVILDVWLGDSDRDGIKILEIIKRDHPYVPVVMISGHGTIETAVTAIKNGAYDFIEKPFQTARLLLVIQRAIESARLKRENADLKIKVGDHVDLVGTSPAMLVIRQTIERVAPTNSRILIVGPSGAGKEIIARKIHALSRRTDRPFVVLNCATLHPDRLEAELFGTEIVGLDPTVPRKIGLLEQAHNGTLYLDEVTDLPLPTQSKLIRVLQDQFFTRLGDNQKVEVDVRITASSSANIPQMIQDGHFREDLFYRLNVVPIDVPALQDRLTDIPELFQHFMNQAALAHGRPQKRLSPDAMVVLQSYSWPGNVRQLKNVVEWILIMAGNDSREEVRADMLPPEVRSDASLSASTQTPNIVVLPLREAREMFEREYLLAQVNRFGGNISKTARFVGMERSALHRKLRALGVHEGRYQEEETSAETSNQELKIA
ncbi:MAG: sigma-54-dependent Fis family transcriptional regulator [Alphaproteobacteria bacterium]|nr:sigma-54-dependent Fis family transcriptional regulator [Alphaproteobacteria bacterium]